MQQIRQKDKSILQEGDVVRLLVADNFATDRSGKRCGIGVGSLLVVTEVGIHWRNRRYDVTYLSKSLDSVKLKRTSITTSIYDSWESIAFEMLSLLDLIALDIEVDCDQEEN